MFWTHDPPSQPWGCKFSSFCIKFRTVFNCCPGEVLQPLEHISASLLWPRFLYLFKHLNIHWVEVYTCRASPWKGWFMSAAGRAGGTGAHGPPQSHLPAAAIGWAPGPGLLSCKGAAAPARQRELAEGTENTLNRARNRLLHLINPKSHLGSCCCLWTRQQEHPWGYGWIAL